jgi:hypothetical protein
MTLRFAGVVCALVLGCVSQSSGQEARNAQATSGAPEFFAAYESALKAHRRDTLAHFYHPAGALIVINGSRMTPTHAGIDSIYRGPGWQGPAFFSFDSLRFEAITPAQVVVTGGFRWLEAQSADTGRYVYLALLQRTSAGLKIRLEHETERPKRQR